MKGPTMPQTNLTDAEMRLQQAAISPPAPSSPVAAMTREERERLARMAIDALYKRMVKAGVVTTAVYDFGVPLVAELIGSVHSQQIADLARRLEEAEKVIEQLPKTADGVPVIRGMKVWHLSSYGPRPYTLRGFRDKTTVFTEEGGGLIWEWDRVYSTEALALAAAKPGQEEKK